MDRSTLYIAESENEFKNLLGINDFPTYEVIYKEISQNVIEECGYGAIGSSKYDHRTGKHTLVVWSDISTLGEVGKQTLFHEFTHILDDEIYVNKSADKYVANHGYTEYHASQISFLRVLRIKTMTEQIAFSMNNSIDTESGFMTIQNYVDAPLFLANELISKVDFPASFEILKDTMGVIFNYFGRRSICKMYSSDFQDTADLSTVAKLLTPQMTSFFKTYMLGWLTDQQIAVLGNFYKDIFILLVKQYSV